MRYRVVVKTVFYVDADDKDDAEDRVSDGMGDLAGTTYRATPDGNEVRDPSVDYRVYEGDDEREIRGY